MKKILLTDSVYQALFIWQIVYLFGWSCLSFIDTSCDVVPMLTYYLIGVGATCILVFSVVAAEVGMADNNVYMRNEIGYKQQMISWKMFQYIYNALGFVHLFWFLFGSINVLPTAIKDGFFLSDASLEQHGCDCPITFWFSSIVLFLQWLLLSLVLIWFQMETIGAKFDSEVDVTSECQSIDSLTCNNRVLPQK